MPLESDSKVEVIVDAEDAPEEDGPLGDDDGDEHGEGDGREAVPPQEGHQEAKTAKQHHVNVQRRCKVGKSGWKPGNITNLKLDKDMLCLNSRSNLRQIASKHGAVNVIARARVQNLIQKII